MKLPGPKTGLQETNAQLAGIVLKEVLRPKRAPPANTRLNQDRRLAFLAPKDMSATFIAPYRPVVQWD